MKLQYPFMQLPVSFDAAALEAEVAAVDESAWRPHPQGYAGNDALTLVTTGGDPDSDAVAGQMRPTPHLERCPVSEAGPAQHRGNLGSHAPDAALGPGGSHPARRRQLLLARARARACAGRDPAHGAIHVRRRGSKYARR